MISELEKKLGLSAMDEDFCASIDKSYMDTGYFHGDEFVFPKMDSTDGVREKVVYLCGNSLGLQPKSLSIEVNAQLTKWGEQGVDGHFTDPTPWLTIDDIVQEDMATLVGALPKETVVMNSLTTNLHLMMASFYVPQGTRNKILIEKKAFPSDVHAVTSQILHHRLNPADCLLEIAPRGGETTLREEDVMEMIEKEGDNIALVLLSGVQYYTGQFFNIADITTRAHAKGCLVGWDLAHAVGNVPLQLHDWDVDFACWCTYKYMNCGPGSIGGCFVHEKHGVSGSMDASNATDCPRVRLAGWWGHRVEDRFVMDPQFIASEGAYGYRLSNPAVLLVACVKASLDMFKKSGGMSNLRERSLVLTSYLEYLLQPLVEAKKVSIFTPTDTASRGCQLSLSFIQDLEIVFASLTKKGIICDVRKPHVMRVAPAPLYNTAKDVYDFVKILTETLQE